MASPVEQWVEEVARTTCPDKIYWCDGSEAENERLTQLMLDEGQLIKLNPAAHPNSYLYRSDPSDVARTEGLTYIVTPKPEDVGPTNNWMSRADAEERVWPLFDGAMRGRTMYVVPYVMGPTESPYAKVGVEVTDSPYVVLNMRIMTRMGKPAMDRLNRGESDWVPGIHSIGDLSPERRFIMHFPEERTIWSIGSGYGGNALLGKKCYALRIASTMGRTQGWMAEHMLILGLESPDGDVTYIAGAFPSACGKTNLAMLKSPLEDQGWKVHTVGEDIAWINIGPDGRLWAINPEAGYFGVAPGTNEQSNPNAMASVRSDTIFTNVALTDDNSVWWEGMAGSPPRHLIDWLGKDWTPSSDTKAAHPNARFTTPATNNPAISSHWEDPRGVPISAILFGGRRADTVPLVAQAYDWDHGVYMGATMASETTAAAEGKMGVVRRDPMAMLPFCGYNMADYWGHWLEMGRRAKNPPAVFQVNWFQRDDDGHFIWPGFGQNMHVLRWVREQALHAANGSHSRETSVGILPTTDVFPFKDLGIKSNDAERLLSVDRDQGQRELAGEREFLAKFGDRLPRELVEQANQLEKRLG